MYQRIIAGILVFAATTTTLWADNRALTIQFIPSSSSLEEALGFGFYALRDDPVGLYGNVATTTREREPHYESLNTGSFGDPITERFKELTVFAVGPTRKLTDSVSVFAGIGYGWGDAKAEKDDPTHILASDGKYYVDDPSNDESGVNANAGVLITPGDNFTVELGYHSFPGTGYIGLGWSF